MPTWRHSRIGSSLIAFLLGTVGGLDRVMAQTAGTVGAVNPNATGQPPGGSASPLGVGQSVVQKERIVTNASGTANIMFTDRSTMSVGRSSSVVVDHFVYNASAGAGDQALSMARGVARFVGGQVSHSSGASVETPVATVGVRGGSITFAHLERITTVMVHIGAATVSTRFGTRFVRAGFQISVGADGFIGELTPIDMDLLRTFTRLLASTGRQTGGARVPPSDSQAARRGIGFTRPSVTTPNFDLPAAGDDLARGFTGDRNRPNNTRPYN